MAWILVRGKPSRPRNPYILPLAVQTSDSMNPLRVSLRFTRVPLLLRCASQKGEGLHPSILPILSIPVHTAFHLVPRIGVRGRLRTFRPLVRPPLSFGHFPRERGKPVTCPSLSLAEKRLIGCRGLGLGRSIGPMLRHRRGLRRGRPCLRRWRTRRIWVLRCRGSRISCGGL